MATASSVLPSWNELEILGLWLGGDFLVTVLFSCWTRQRTDQDQDGVIQVSEVPFILRTDRETVVINSPTLYDLSLLTFARIPEAFLHSFCYGSLVVFGMNWGMPDIDHRFGYLFTISIIFMANMFMCTYATNGIHVTTSHMMHFVYYGCGYIPLVYYNNNDFEVVAAGESASYGWLLVVGYTLFRLTVYYIGRRYALPNYPAPGRLLRLYKYNETTKEWDFASAPKCGFDDDEPYRRTSTIQRAWGPDPLPEEVEGGVPPTNALNRWALTYPTYEVLNLHFSSSFAIGIGTASIACPITTAALPGLVPYSSSVVPSETYLYVAIVSAILVALVVQTIGLYGFIENQLHNGLVLSRFWPKTSAMILAACGGASVVWNLEVGRRDDSDIVAWTSHGAVLAGALLTYGFAFLAHFGHNLYRPITNADTDTTTTSNLMKESSTTTIDQESEETFQDEETAAASGGS